MALEIHKPGALSTVQDKGRSGYFSQGFQESGACDKYSMKLANMLAGNLNDYKNAAVVEFTLKGGEIHFTSEEIIVLAGADMSPTLNGTPITMYCPVLVKAGDILTLGVVRKGIRTYLAVYGGIDVPLVMGSRSTNLKCKMGGLDGRALRAGDVLESAKSPKEIKRFKQKLKGREEHWAAWSHEPWYRLPSTPHRFYGSHGVILLRVVPGPQEEAFTEVGRKTFIRKPYRLSMECDRMACRLEGPAIEMKAGADIISDGIVEGSVQVSASGLPMVMMADHQTTGGYAKIATVISADIPTLAQLRPGDEVAFQYVTPKQAVTACRNEENKLRELREQLENSIRGWNLIWNVLT